MKANNLVILLGHLGVEPEAKQLDNGTTKVRLRLATSDRWRSRDGEKKERTDWHTIDAWDKTADFCMRFLKKGDRIQVVGTIRNDVVAGNDGRRRTFSSIRAWDVNLLSEWGDREPRQQRARSVNGGSGVDVASAMPF